MGSDDGGHRGNRRDEQKHWGRRRIDQGEQSRETGRGGPWESGLTEYIVEDKGKWFESLFDDGQSARR